MFFEGMLINAAMKQVGFSEGLDRLAAECPLSENSIFILKKKESSKKHVELLLKFYPHMLPHLVNIAA